MASPNWASRKRHNLENCSAGSVLAAWGWRWCWDGRFDLVGCVVGSASDLEILVVWLWVCLEDVSVWMGF